MKVFLKNFKIFSHNYLSSSAKGLYNIALPFMTFMFLIRGTIQVLNITLSNTTNAIISGIAGISHIFISAVLFLLFLSLKKVVK